MRSGRALLQGMEYGSPSSTLADAGLDAARTAVGHAGELATAAVLHDFVTAHPEVAVLHSLRLPDPKAHADIDHALVSGRRVWLIDSKCWQPGFYWSLGGRHYRGLTPAPHTGKRTMDWAARAVRACLGPAARVETPLVVVWPSRDGAARLAFYRPVGARAVAGRRLAWWLEGHVRARQAEPGVVAALRALQG